MVLNCNLRENISIIVVQILPQFSEKSNSLKEKRVANDTIKLERVVENETKEEELNRNQFSKQTDDKTKQKKKGGINYVYVLITKKKKNWQDEICSYACRCATEKKEKLFVDILERYNQDIIWNRGFKIYGWTFFFFFFFSLFFFLLKKKDLLSHLVSRLSGNNVMCARYVLESDMIKIGERQDAIKNALETAILQQETKGIKVLMSAKFMSEKDKMTREYAMTQMKQRSKIEELLGYLKKMTSGSEFDVIMKGLTKTLLAMIKDGKLISSDVFNMCWLYDKEKLWEVLFKKCTEILNINTLHDHCNDWKWIEEHLVDNRDLLVWMDDLPLVQKKKKKEEHKTANEEKDNDDDKGKRIRWEEIRKLCESQSFKHTNQFHEEINAEISKFEQEYRKLVFFQWTSNKDNTAQKQTQEQKEVKAKNKCRQDDDELGVQSLISEKELLDVQINSGDVAFHPKHSYDFDVYLNDLLTRAHEMNRSYQTEMANLFKGCQECTFSEGPIKTHERCKLKAQLDYKHEQFPKSAHVIDILRCQVIFTNIDYLVQGLNHFMRMMESPPYCNSFKVVRMKNGFAKYSSVQSLDGKVRVPQEYEDVKMNVLFTENGKSIVTEVQFLLQIMARFKQNEHPFYEIQRQESLLMDSLLVMNDLSFHVQLRIASFAPVDMANLMLYFPNHFRQSTAVQNFKNAAGSNFCTQMASNPQVTLQYAKALLQSGDFIPLDVVQAQLYEKNEEGRILSCSRCGNKSLLPAYNCLYLRTRITLEPCGMRWTLFNTIIFINIYIHICVHIYIHDNYSCIHFGVANEYVDLIKMLQLLKDNIRDEERWQSLIQLPERGVCIYDVVQGLSKTNKQTNKQKTKNEKMYSKDFAH
ncbi:hypothetical protein RFI_22376 [Reticulomyxa filosa]|uniref:Uncharacterized protein n=1 Tax=Reticulomyxa filosa TaxID=46433 RepID=X6MMC7_RETFI|nr:hypothetical protein RFI_22376 [Reticulomyxa filosa]|eukprot:ETO14994.1 hypothetical protein RFI_22376 [Reticulomyxa filosa]